MITFGDIVTKVLQRLSLVEGLDAQIYAEPRIQLAIQHKFDLIFREYWLPEYTVYQEPHVLDGVNGYIVDDMTDKITDWRDLHSVFHENSHKQMPRAPMSVRDIDITYPSIRPAATVSGHMFRVVPHNTAGIVYVTYRSKPPDFQEDSDPIYLDTQLLLLGTCWDVLEDDGTNPGASDKFRMLFQDALTQFNRQQHNIPLDTIPSTRSVVNRWT
jgi:hypothetical protein